MRRKRKDPELPRPYNVEFNVAVDRQSDADPLGGRCLVSARLYNQSKTDNLLIAPTDYAAVPITNPLTNEPITIYNLNRAKLGQSDVLDTTATDDSFNRKSYQGFEAAFNVRLPKGASIFGGWWSDKDIAVTCDGDNPNTFLYCDQSVAGHPVREQLQAGRFSAARPTTCKFGTSVQSYAGAPLTVSWVGPGEPVPGRTQRGGHRSADRGGHEVPGSLDAGGRQLQKSITIRQTAVRRVTRHVQRAEQ